LLSGDDGDDGEEDDACNNVFSSLEGLEISLLLPMNLETAAEVDAVDKDEVVDERCP
jgi:hypothetical protein